MIVMRIETLEHSWDLRYQQDWEAAYNFLKYTCPTHGHEAALCHDYWTSACNNATYGFPCLACGHVDRDIHNHADDVHDEMCCGQEGECGDAGGCATHGYQS